MAVALKVKAGIPNHMDDGDNPSFEEWMGRIDRLLVRARGFSVYDLPDCTFRDWYEERVRPIRAANRALRRAGAFCE